MKVFLGGTCAGWKWRDELQPLLKCDYYNPIVKNWSEEDRLREVHERETSDYVLYGITNGIKDVVDIAPITIHIVSRVTLHLAHHMAHQFQRGINAESVEE